MGPGVSKEYVNKVQADLGRQLSSIRNELSSTKSNLGASRNEVEGLKQQLSTCQNTLQQLDIQLHKALEFGKQLPLTNIELEKLKKHIQFREKFQQDIGTKLHRMILLENQVNSCNIDVLSSKNYLEISNIEVNALGEKLMSFDKFHENMKLKLDKVMELETLLSSIEVNLVETRAKLKASKEDEDGLRNELLGHDHVERDIEMKLGHVLELEKQIQMAMSQATLGKECLEGLRKEEGVLREQVMCFEKYQKDIELKLMKMMRLEKGIRVSNSEALFAKESIETTRNEEVALREELYASEKVLQNVEMNIKKYLSCNDAEVLKAKNDLEGTKEKVKEIKEKLV